MRLRGVLVATALCCAAYAAPANPTVKATRLLGPFSGVDAALHPANLAPHPIRYYGTDLGFSYAHGGRVQFLFGDTWATETYSPIQASTQGRFDDGFGSAELKAISSARPARQGSPPPILLGQSPDSGDMSAIDPGTALDLGKTPIGGFSSGDREFALFNLTRPKACMTDAQCPNDLSCDLSLGVVGAPLAQDGGLTLACNASQPGCRAAEFPGHAGPAGLCSDRRSSVWADTAAGHVAAVALTLRAGVRDLEDPRRYTHPWDWVTTKFLNVAVRADARSGRVYLWGRPAFIGVGARARPAAVYLAYLDLPNGGRLDRRIRYFSGLAHGAPRFSLHESDALALELSGPEQDVINQMSVAWNPSLKRWLMFFGGGAGTLPTPALPHCGELELFARADCGVVRLDNGAIRMRTAELPWGPWSAAQVVVEGGDARTAAGQYGAGGALHAPACTVPGCAPHSNMRFYHPDEYGFLYGANIIEEWSYADVQGIHVIWNASTWDPYRIVLFETVLTP